ncbi:hypothetical protein ACIRL2_45195 [Embleya sp. NPDC127516]|uniref:hypothetical protein n=1 Tax=Embleya sp. NPDC127516 TaxID=3363990 RepID=UPI0038030A21
MPSPSEDGVCAPELPALRVAADDIQDLLTEACLHRLNARLCEEDEALDDYLPPQKAAMARKVANTLEERRPADG